MPIQSLNGPPDAGGKSGLTPPVTRNVESSAAAATLAPAQTAAPAKAAAPQADAPEPSLDEVKQAVEKVQQSVKSLASSLQFSVDKDSGKTVVTLTDVQSGEVIRQMPSKEMVELARNIDRMQGMLLKQKA